MKLMFASDIHGSRSACERVLERYDAEGADRLILLGDLLYHGPRNDLPESYAPKAVISLLNARKNELLCVRGNCEAEVDQMVLEFPVMADYMLLPLLSADGRERTAFVTHGHLYNLSALPPHKKGDLLIHGHTHVLCVREQDDVVYINPGSAALPKEGNPKSYMIYDAGVITIKTLEGEEILSYAL